MNFNFSSLLSCSYICYILLFLWFSHLWKIYIWYRQYSLINKVDKVPSEIRTSFNDNELIKAKNYQKELLRFSFFHSFYSQFELTFILCNGLIVYSWNIAGFICNYFGFDATNEIFHTQIWTLLTNTIFLILNQPWKLYKTFILEEKHGFNKMTLGIYVKDSFKAWIISNIIEMPAVAILILSVKYGGEYVFFYTWFSISIIILALLWIYPTWIAPLFDKYTALEPGDLRSKIEQLSLRISFPLSEIYIVDSSRKTSHSNAYFYGFGSNKRIVLFDTLLNKGSQEMVLLRCRSESSDNLETSLRSGNNSIEGSLGQATLDSGIHVKSNNNESLNESSMTSVANDSEYMNSQEILAVIAHELGHWFYNHNLKSLVLNELVLLAYCLFFSSLLRNTELYICFGFDETQPIIIGFVVIFGFIFAPFDLILSFLINQLIRSFEFSADKYATQMNLGRFLSSALIKLTRDNKSFPVDDPLYSVFYKSHPSTLERILAIKSYKVE